MADNLNEIKQECFKLKNRIEYLNHNYKSNNSYVEFFKNESKLLDDLRTALFTSSKIVNKVKRAKRKLEFTNQLSSKCQLKSKKINEKHLVINQLEIKSETNHETNKNPGITNRPGESIDISTSVNIPDAIKRKCYACKEKYHDFHAFYDSLCPACAKLNYAKRTQTCDFTGKVALVTGCRIKIGYEICLYLLRNNCMVIGTTRFSKDAFLRYSKEPDFSNFKHLLKIYPLDLRDLGAVNKFINYLYSNYDKLDILINNAAQTLRRNIQFYKHLLDVEMKPLESFGDETIYQVLPIQNTDLWSSNSSVPMLAYQHDDFKDITLIENKKVSVSVIQSQIPVLKEDFEPDLRKFPVNILDKDQQQVDLTEKSSWKLEIDEINMFEFAETQFINAWTPFMLCSKLKGLMMKGDYESRFIVNVSSMEGKFDRRYKSSQHSHTNMSKASLNMITRTCGSHYAKYRIYMTSVDTGWVSEMNPSHLYSCYRTVPLDEIDGAMRVLDPIIQGLKDKIYLHSVFLKDYKETSW